MVVLVHVNIYIRHGVGLWWPGGFALVPIFAVPVPTFLVLSGFFAGSYAPAVKRPGIFAFLHKKLRVLIVPFLVWNVILLLLDGGGRGMSAGEVLISLVAGYWQLYYISLLIQLLLLHHVLAPHLEGSGLYWFLGVSAALAVGFAALADTALWTRGAASGWFETRAIALFPPWLIFFATGVWLRRRPGDLARLADQAGGLALLTGLAYALYYWEFRREEAWLGFNPLQQFLAAGLPFRFLSPLLLLVGLFKLEERGIARRLRLWLAGSANDTYGIYLSHTTAIVLLFALWQASGFGTVHWVEVPILWAASWILCRWGVRAVRSLRLRTIGLLLFGTARRA